MEKINILHILAGAKEYNGVSDFLLSHYEQMNREKIHFDFMFCRENTMKSRMDEHFLQNSEFIELNIPITGKPMDSLKLIQKVRGKLIKSRYDIVHINTGSIMITALCVLAARMAKNRHIIAHSHNTDPKSARKYNAARRAFVDAVNGFMRRYIRTKSSLLFACSREAGEYLFGKAGVESNKFHVLRNAISVDRFLYNEIKRTELRREYNIENGTIVLGCVGRFSTQKNHEFLIDVYREYLEINPNSMLWLIGDGDTKSKIEEKTQVLGIGEHVRFFGQRRDVHELLQAMDGFVLTSFFEGLGIVSIEAQAAGLKVFLPEEISHESEISDLVKFISLREKPKVWAKQINDSLAEGYDRRDMTDVVRKGGYDIKESWKMLEEYYISLL